MIKYMHMKTPRTTLIFRDIHIVWSPSLQNYALSYRGHDDVTRPAGLENGSTPQDMLTFVMDNYDECYESAHHLFRRSEILTKMASEGARI